MKEIRFREVLNNVPPLGNFLATPLLGIGPIIRRIFPISAKINYQDGGTKHLTRISCMVTIKNRFLFVSFELKTPNIHLNVGKVPGIFLISKKQHEILKLLRSLLGIPDKVYNLFLQCRELSYCSYATANLGC